MLQQPKLLQPEALGFAKQATISCHVLAYATSSLGLAAAQFSLLVMAAVISSEATAAITTSVRQQLNFYQFFLLNLVIYNLITCWNVNEGKIYFEKTKIIDNKTANANTN